MKSSSIAVSCVAGMVILFSWAPLAQASVIQLGLLAADEILGEVAQAAYDWANDSYPSTLLMATDTGDFTNTKGNKQSLDSFAVLWLHYSETGTLPAPFLTDETLDAVKGYLESGGTLFLTALALHYAFDLEAETGAEPRVFTPLGKEPPEIGVMPTAEGAKHPIFAGFDTSDSIFLCSMAQDGFTSDFQPVPGDVSGVLLATKTRGGGAGAGERPLVEFDVGKGKIITLGHHNAVYTDDGSDEGENLRTLTKNIIEYLAENSAFLAVEPRGKLTVTWGEVKMSL